jgi:hypothetical protein
MKKDDLVEVEFWDHSSGHEPYHFRVWGRVQKVTKKFVRIMTWDWVDNANVNYVTDENVEGFSILKSCITKVRRLRRE